MKYAILRTEKLKKSDVGGMAKHHDRTRTTLNADPDKKSENSLLAGVPSSQVPIIIQERIQKIEGEQGKKTRKDAVAAIEVLMTASPDFFKDKSDGYIRAWGERSVDWSKSHFGADNVVSAVLHRDETTPHLHVVVFPETPDHKLSAKHWLDGFEKMQSMQDSYAEAVEYAGLERGIKGSKAKHTDIKRWYAEGLPKAREQVIAMTERARELGVNIENHLKHQFSEFLGIFASQNPTKEQGLSRVQERTRQLEPEKAKERQKENEQDWGISR